MPMKNYWVVMVHKCMPIEIGSSDGGIRIWVGLFDRSPLLFVRIQREKLNVK